MPPEPATPPQRVEMAADVVTPPDALPPAEMPPPADAVIIPVDAAVPAEDSPPAAEPACRRRDLATGLRRHWLCWTRVFGMGTMTFPGPYSAFDRHPGMPLQAVSIS